MKTVIVFGKNQYAWYCCENLKKHNYNCRMIVTEGIDHPILDVLHWVQDELQIKGFVKHLTNRTSSNIKISESDLVLICVDDPQKETDFIIKALHAGANESNIFCVPTAICTGKIDIFQNDRLNEQIIHYKKRKPSLRYLETHITDFCNLKCYGCGHMCDKIEEMSFADVDSFLLAFKKLSELFSNIKVLRLMGGEPLLCENLFEYIDIAYRFFPHSDIRIVSNGLLYNKLNESTIESIKRTGTSLQISQYPPTRQLANQIISFCSERDIPLLLSAPVTKFFRGRDSGKPKDQATMWKKCSSRHCHFLDGTRIYPCTGVCLRYKYSRFSKRPLSKEEHDNNSFDVTDSNINDGYSLIESLESPFPLCVKCGDIKEYFDWKRSNESV